MLHSMGPPRVEHDLATEQQQLASAESQGCPTPTPGGARGKGPACQCRKHRDSDLIPGREDPWGRAWQPTPVFLPGESHGQGSLAALSPEGCKESDTTEAS